MNYCDVVNGYPPYYTFSFKGWYFIKSLEPSLYTNN